MSDLVLLIDGTRHRGWTEAQVRRSLESMADSFEVELTERWADDAQPRAIRTGQAVSVEIEGERVITGYVDDVLPAYDDQRHAIVVSGRSRTADLVDSSGEERNWERPRTLLQVARELCEPFDIEVVAEVDVGEPLQAPAVEPGQPYGEALGQMARHRAVLLVADAEGRLVITRPPRTHIETALVLGENIRSASGRFSDVDRFAEVIVEGHSEASDAWSGEQAASPAGRATDARVGRHRSALVLSDVAVTKADCDQRAEWEVRRRWGESRGVTYTVSGWRHADGLWRPGDLVGIRDRWLGIHDAWLIESTQQLLDAQGERTEIRVVPPSAYDLRAEPEPEPQDEGSPW